MINTMGIIVAHEKEIAPITNRRQALALPVCGSYRIIDFPISCMANSKISNIGIVTDSNYTSLMNHIRSGKPWDLDTKTKGISILPPNLANVDYAKIRGNLNMLTGAKDFLTESNETYVILCLGTYIYNINFSDCIKKHIENESDITVIYKDLKGTQESELSKYTLLEISNDRISDIESYPQYPKSTNASLEIYIMEKALLESIIDESSARGDHDFIKDAISKKLAGLIVRGYEYKGYFDKINSIKSYYYNNMIFLDDDIKDSLFTLDNPIYTKSIDMPPARYFENSNAKNCIISSGCKIYGNVSNSILSKGIIIKKNAIVQNCILMENTVVEEGAILDSVICDNNVKITKGKRIIGTPNFPIAINRNEIIF